MHGRWLAALTIVIVVAALATGNVLLLRLGYVLVAVLLVAAVLAFTSVRGVEIARHTRTRRTEVGGLCEESVAVANRSWLPKLWLEVQDHSDLPGHRASRVVTTLGPGRQRSWSARTPCRRRGVYTLGPMTISGGDPLGMFRLERELERTTPFVVYPRTVPLPGFDLPSGYLPGGPAARRRAQFATTNVRGVRSYVPGDAFGRIHWPTTARRNRLYTKEFELDPISDVWLLLDMQREVHVGEASEPEEDHVALLWPFASHAEIEPSTEEYAITIAASLGRRFIEVGKSVGLIAYGQRRVVLQPDRGDRQLSKILSTLAVLRAVGKAGLAEVLTVESYEFSRHMTLVCITPTTTLRWVDALRELRYRGVPGMAVHIEPTTFGTAGSSEGVLTALAARNVPTRVVRQGDDLAVALRG